MALESSPTKTLPFKQIYEWMQWKFLYYRTTPPGWKISVRHNLSLNKCFKKVEKFSRKTQSAVTKGGLWTTDLEYRESLLEALKLNPYHPYHKYFTAPYFPRYSRDFGACAGKKFCAVYAHTMYTFAEINTWSVSLFPALKGHLLS